MSEYTYKKGMKPPGDVPGRNRKQFDSALVYLPKPVQGKPVILRPVGGVCTLGVHKLRFTKADGSPSGFKTLCPDWDIENQAPRDNKRTCPICRDFSTYGLPKEVKIPLVFDYLFHAFHVTNIKAKTEPQFGLVGNVNMMNWPELLEVTQLNAGIDLFDAKNGCCISWSARPSKFAPGQFEMHFAQGQPLRTMWKDDLWVTKVDGVQITGEEQDILSLIMEPDADEMAESLDRLGFYKRLEAATGNRRTGGKFVPPQSQDQNDDFEETAPPPSKPATKTAKAPVDDLDDPDLDDADEDDLEATTPAPKTATKAPKGKPAPAPVADDLDDLDADDNDAEPPPAKPATKGKAAPKAKPAPAPAADDDDLGLDEDDPPAPDPAKAKPIPKKPKAPEPPADDEWDD